MDERSIFDGEYMLMLDQFVTEIQRGFVLAHCGNGGVGRKGRSEQGKNGEGSRLGFF